MSSPPPDRISGHKRTRAAEEDISEDGSAVYASNLDIGIPVHQRACVRCKNLKVKCEVKSVNEIVTEPCRRCKNAGYECVLPGTKKRKAPPKRGDLMQTIQEQANQLRHLQDQLTALRNGQSLSPSNSIDYSNSAIQRGNSFTSYRETPASEAAEPEVRNWIISAVSELSEEEEEDQETEEEEFDYGSNGNGVSQASSGDSKRSPPGPKTLRGITSTIPSEGSPFALMASLSIQASSSAAQKRAGSGSDHVEEEGVGLTEPAYFAKGPAPDSLRGSTSSINQRLSPSIFTDKLITTTEAEQLFQIYYERINASVFLLDPTLYNAQQTCLRNTFLFTVVCAIASRFLPNRYELYDRLMEHALVAAGVTLSSGAKSVEIVYAYVLLALYPRPQRRWEDDRGYWYIGVAVRVAMDLNIHHPPKDLPADEKKAREALNRTRAWTACWIWDRVLGSFTGKDPLGVAIDALSMRGDEWYHCSPFNIAESDPMVSAMIVCQRVLYLHRGKIYTDPSSHMGLNLNQDFRALGVEADNEMKTLENMWSAHLREIMPDTPQTRYRIAMLLFYYKYARLRYLNFCIAHTSAAQHQEDTSLLRRCHTAALEVTQCFQHELARSELRSFVRHGPDCNSLIVTIAGTVIVKLLTPQYANFFSPEEQNQMRSRIKAVTGVLKSPDVSVDERHAPYYQALFLELVSDPSAGKDAGAPRPEQFTPPMPYMGEPRTARANGFTLNPIYPADITSPASAVRMSSAFEPALMDLYNTVRTPAAGASWTYAPGSTAGMYTSSAHGHHHGSGHSPESMHHQVNGHGLIAGMPAADTEEWYRQQQQEVYPSAYSYQDAFRYPPGTAPISMDMGMQPQWPTSGGQYMNMGYANSGQNHMYGYNSHQ